MPSLAKNVASQVRLLRSARLPFLMLWTAGATVVACLAGGTFLGFQISGLTWFLTLLLALLVLIRQAGSVRLPLWLWLPWVALVITYMSTSHYAHAFQRSVMLLCPLAVGAAVSSFPIPAEKVRGLSLLIRFTAVALLGMVFINTGLLVTGQLPGTSGLASQSITACLLACYFAAEFAHGNKRALVWWGLMAFIPIIGLTRMAILAAGCTLPFTLAPLSMKKRTLMAVGGVALLVAVFYTPRVQHKMFYSGHGSITDLSMNNPDLATSGRRDLWAAMEYRIRANPWFGYGANASEKFVVDQTGGLTHPHNDWLRLRYDYGWLGTSLYFLCIMAQVFHSWRKARSARGDVKTLLLAGASSFLPFAMIMYTDNIILYAAFFGNLQFALIGMGYSASYETQRAQAVRRAPKIIARGPRFTDLRAAR